MFDNDNEIKPDAAVMCRVLQTEFHKVIIILIIYYILGLKRLQNSLL